MSVGRTPSMFTYGKQYAIGGSLYGMSMTTKQDESEFLLGFITETARYPIAIPVKYINFTLFDGLQETGYSRNREYATFNGTSCITLVNLIDKYYTSSSAMVALRIFIQDRLYEEANH